MSPMAFARREKAAFSKMTTLTFSLTWLGHMRNVTAFGEGVGPDSDVRRWVVRSSGEWIGLVGGRVLQVELLRPLWRSFQNPEVHKHEAWLEPTPFPVCVCVMG